MQFALISYIGAIMRRMIIAACALIATFSTASPVVAARARLKLALIPPPGNLAIETAFRKACADCGVSSRVLTPDSFVDPRVFNVGNFPVALYSGAEAYLFTAHRAGDAIDAVLRYIRDGGVLIVTGNVWPFIDL